MTVSEEMVERGAKAIYDVDPWDDNLPWDRVPKLNADAFKMCARAALTAALSDQVVVPNGWQPIESAPKHNRVFVDLWFPQRDVGEYGRVPDCQYLANETTPGWYAANDENDSLYYIGDGATHWMFRPKSPAPPREVSSE